MKELEKSKIPTANDFENLRVKESYLRAINQFALTLIEITTVEDLVWHVAREVVGQLDFVDCVIYLLDTEHNELVQRAAIGAKSPKNKIIVNPLRIPIGSAITGTVAASRQPIIVNNTETDDRYLPDIEHLGSEICVPLIYNGELLGVIDSEHPEKNYFTQDHLEVLTTIAAMTSASVAQCRTLRSTRTQAEIIQQVSESVLLIREGGTIIDCNAGAEALHNLNRDELIGLKINDVVESGLDFKVFEPEVKAQLENAGKWTGRVKFKRGANQEVITGVSVTKLVDSDTQDTIYISVARDITEQVEKERLQRELQQSQKMESLGHLTGGIAHDFNNLLGIITGYSSLALTKYENVIEEKLTNYLTQIRDASERATNLVSQMLAFSRSEVIEKSPVQLDSLLQENIKLIRSTLPTSIEIVTEFEPDLPKVLVDQNQVHQILMNLSINARDAIEGVGQLKFYLGWAQSLDTVSQVSHKPIKGDWLELSVSDTGTGIDPASIEKIFNPFFTTKEVGKGTGMGLSIIYKIMEAHNGHILVESELGVGSTFRLLFKPITEDLGFSHDDNEIDIKEIPRGKGSNILIVDDEESLGLLLSQAVEEYGYQTRCISDSMEALKFFEQSPEDFDLIITDQTMPKMSGIELITKIRAIRPDVAVILCTGYSDKVDANIAKSLDIPFFEKPADIKKLLFKIASLLK